MRYGGLAMSNASLAHAQEKLDRRFYVLTGVVSVAALSLLAWLLVFREGEPGAGLNLRFMPAVNAGLNTVSTVLLVLGYVFIRRKDTVRHQRSMQGAFIASALFLVGYLAYHYVHGDTRYAGEGLLRAVYLFILASHVLLSIIVFPLVLVTFYLSYTKRFARHRKLARFVLPAWLYVSVTGVVIFFMLRSSLPAVP